MNPLEGHQLSKEPPLDILRAARANIKPQNFRFDDWKYCTCGHIYKATYGKYSDDAMFSHGSEPHYMEALEIIGAAYGLAHAGPQGVSSLTEYIALFGERPKTRRDLRAKLSRALYDKEPPIGKLREAALQILDTAIAFEEKRQAKAMARVK